MKYIYSLIYLISIGHFFTLSHAAELIVKEYGWYMINDFTVFGARSQDFIKIRHNADESLYILVCGDSIMTNSPPLAPYIYIENKEDYVKNKDIHVSSPRKERYYLIPPIISKDDSILEIVYKFLSKEISINYNFDKNIIYMAKAALIFRNENNSKKYSIYLMKDLYIYPNGNNGRKEVCFEIKRIEINELSSNYSWFPYIKDYIHKRVGTIKTRNEGSIVEIDLSDITVL